MPNQYSVGSRYDEDDTVTAVEANRWEIGQSIRTRIVLAADDGWNGGVGLDVDYSNESCSNQHISI